MASDTVIKVLTGTHITATSLSASQNIKIKHGVNAASFSRSDLSPRRPFYQAKLHPELVCDAYHVMCGQLWHPETLVCDLPPRRPLYQAKLHPDLSQRDRGRSPRQLNPDYFSRSREQTSH
jgi:hypothetical protein